MATLSYLYPYFDHRIVPTRTSFDAHSAVFGQAGSACLPDTVRAMAVTAEAPSAESSLRDALCRQRPYR